MTKKKILIVTYYWPPSGGGGVQRWLKFVKYLPEFGWEPIVFTPENPEFDLKDDSLSKDVDPNLEVIRFPIWEPFSFYKRLFKKGERLKQGIVIEKSKMSLTDRLSVWVRANFFIPDPRRFWVAPSIDFLKDYIDEHKIDVLVTTGPPHSMHLIGRGLKRKCNIKWVADFRDPWSDWDILDKLNVSGLVRGIHQRMERSVLNEADLCITVSRRLAQALATKSENKNIPVITNGVDPDDFELDDQMQFEAKFRITHMGLLNEIRNPESLWEVLESLCAELPGFQEDLQIILAGMVSGSILDRLQESKELSQSLKHLDYISHHEVFGYYKNSSILLLLLNQTENAKWILPGKFFEYLMAGQQILTLGEPDSDIQDILLETESGEVFKFDDKVKIRQMIKSAYERFKAGESTQQQLKTKRYLRRNLTQELSIKLDQLLAD
ncbi:MAG: glycosyltransferase family 4 protein [Reichenbachiella sp.]|uniref:glycosyltransferase family 4 protein n=1 Tax=Reichenbachiella sp. TaxID=2184521 RepID=UPI0032676CBD